MSYIYRIRKNVPGVGRKLARALNLKELTSKKPMEKIPEGSAVINYGRSVVPEWERDDIETINHPDFVSLAVDKIKTLEKLWKCDVPTLQFTTEKITARSWLDNGSKIVARLTSKGKKGKGVVLVNPGDELPDAPLYTLHYNKDVEFRVHVVFGRVIDYVQKKKMGKAKLAALGIEQANMDVRNHGKGWVFAHNNVIKSELVEQIALDAVEALGLDFAGVDVLAKVEHGEVYDAVVCEVNSAPGMSSTTTFNAYVNAFREALEV